MNRENLEKLSAVLTAQGQVNMQTVRILIDVAKQFPSSAAREPIINGLDEILKKIDQLHNASMEFMKGMVEEKNGN